jgi:hypothetical protein
MSLVVYGLLGHEAQDVGLPSELSGWYCETRTTLLALTAVQGVNVAPAVWAIRSRDATARLAGKIASAFSVARLLVPAVVLLAATKTVSSANGTSYFEVGLVLWGVDALLERVSIFVFIAFPPLLVVFLLFVPTIFWGTIVWLCGLIAWGLFAMYVHRYELFPSLSKPPSAT